MKRLYVDDKHHAKLKKLAKKKKKTTMQELAEEAIDLLVKLK